MRTGISLLASVLILGLFLYFKLLPYHNRLAKKYQGIYKFLEKIFEPLLNLLNRVIKPLQIGQGLSIDLAQIALLILLLITINSL